MESFRRKIGFVILVLCFLALVVLLWFCLFYRAQAEEPGGTLVYDRCISVQQEAAV